MTQVSQFPLLINTEELLLFLQKIVKGKNMEFGSFTLEKLSMRKGGGNWSVSLNAMRYVAP